MNKLIELSPIDAQVHWPEAEEHLAKAVGNEYEEQQLRIIKGRVFAGLNTLWKVEEEGQPVAWCTTLIYTGDGLTNIVQIQLGTSEDLKFLLDKIDEFEVWAFNHGAHYIEVVGRQGWTKPLKALGFEHNYTSLLKQVYEELH
jgi:hypothetical protein